MDDASVPAMKRSPRAGALAFTARALRRLGRRMAERYRNRRGHQELDAMSDLDLEDLGISRMDIDAIFARKHDRARPNLLKLIEPDRHNEWQSASEAILSTRIGENDRGRR